MKDNISTPTADLLRTLPYGLGADTDIEFTSDGGMRFTMSMPWGPAVLAE
jgi:hypothetical protein